MTRRTRTQRKYFRRGSQFGKLFHQLADTADPKSRAEILLHASALAQECARLHWQAFGPDPNPDEDGRDLSTSLAYESTLLNMLAQAEATRADGITRDPDEDALGAAAAPALEQLANPANDRAAELERLYADVEPIVGGQAAEIIACLPTP